MIKNKLVLILIKNKLIDSLHEKQKMFILSKSKRIAAICSRRAGKSHAIAIRLLISTIDSPNELAIFITQSQSTSVEILWPAIQRISEEHKLKIEKITQNGQVFVIPEWGGRILLAGCPTSADINKFRGDRASVVCIDEAYNIDRWLKKLVEEVLEPRLLDTQGQLYLTGTPGDQIDEKNGYFYAVSTYKYESWDVHHWTVLNNPFMQNVQEYLDLKRKEMTPDSFSREWKGIWVKNNDTLIYPFDTNNIVSPSEVHDKQNWKIIIGMDLGYNDACAWTVLYYRYGCSKIYVMEAFKEINLTPSQAADRTHKLKQKYPTGIIYADSGGLGKGYIEEFRLRHGITCMPADKLNKLGSINELSDFIKLGRLKILNNGLSNDLVNEMNQLYWNNSKSEENQMNENHLCDALRYGFKQVPSNYLFDHVEKTQEELQIQEAQKLKKQAMRKYKR
jgi:phage terminase large subunit